MGRLFVPKPVEIRFWVAFVGPHFSFIVPEWEIALTDPFPNCCRVVKAEVGDLFPIRATDPQKNPSQAIYSPMGSAGALGFP